MHKPLAFIGLILLSNSVLAPLTANAQTIATSSITASTSATTGMTTTQVDPIQELSSPTYSVTLTSYNAVPDQTDSTPDTTSIGVFTNPEVVAARSSDLATKLPYGTIIAIDGPSTSGGTSCGYDSVSNLIGYRVIADAMNPRMHDKIDVLLNPTDKVSVGYRQVNPSVALGACTGVTVRVVGYVNPSSIPQSQAALADLVNESQHLASAQF